MSLVPCETNGTAAAPTHVTTSEDEFAAFELLPIDLRYVLMSATYPIASYDVLIRWDALKMALGVRPALHQLVRELRQSELYELEDFAAEQGYSAHLAADASFQRYGAF